jgi:hypothetical protein
MVRTLTSLLNEIASMLGLDDFQAKINFVCSEDKSQEMLVKARSFVDHPLQTKPLTGVAFFFVENLGLQKGKANFREFEDRSLAITIQERAINAKIIHAAVSKRAAMRDIRKVIVGAEMGRNYFYEAPGSGDAMQFLHGCHDIVKMTQRMAAHHVVEGIVGKGPRVDVQIMDDVNLRGYHIVDPQKSWQFSRPATNVEFLSNRFFLADRRCNSAHVRLPVKDGPRYEDGVHSRLKGIQRFHCTC